MTRALVVDDDPMVGKTLVDLLGLLVFPATRATGIEGFGLGLSPCERIVRAHEGRFEVASTPGEGSTFSFTVRLFGARARLRSPLVVAALFRACHAHPLDRRALTSTLEGLGAPVS